VREVVEDLIGLDAGAAGHLQERRHVAEVEVADAPVPDQAGALEVLEPGDGLLQRHRPAPVQEIQVELVGGEAREALRARVVRALASRTAGPHLPDEEHLAAPPGDRLPDEPLALPVRVELGGVDECHAEIDAGAQRLDLDLPRMAALGEVPRAHAEGGDRLAARKVDGGHREHGHVPARRTQAAPDQGGTL